MNAEWLNPLVQQLGWTLLHFIWQGALVGVLFGLGLFLLRDAAAGSRYAMAVATLGLLALLPPATFFYLGATAGATPTEAITAPSPLLLLVTGQGVATATGPGPLLWVVAAWLIGVLVMTSRLWLGWRHLVRLRRGADPAAALSLRPLLEQLCRRIGIARPVQVALSRQVRSPVVIGWLKPLILLPPAVINRLPRDQIEMVLAHELAHIRRNDHLVNLFQTVVETVLFYHPVVAWVSRRIRVERENACDDLVVHSTGDRLAYVEMLAALERMRFQGPRLALAVNDGQILGRIRRLVEQSRPRRQRGLVIPAMLLSATLAAGVGVSLVPDDPGAEPDQNRLGASPEPGRMSENPTSPVRRLDQVPTPPASTPTAEASIELTSSGGAAAETSFVGPRPAATTDVANAASGLPVIASVPATESPSPENVDPAGTEAQARPEIPPRRSAEAERVARVTTTEMENDAAGEPADRRVSAGSGAGEALMMASLPRNPERTLRDDEPPVVALEPEPIIGGDLIRRVEPFYPGRAHRRLTGGQVELEFVVGRDGRVDDIEILQETPQRWRFGEAAAAAVAQWEFEPFRRGDQPMERTVRVEVVFEPDRSTCGIRTGTRIPSC